MAKVDATWEQLIQGVALATKERNTFVVKRNNAELIEVDERQFSRQGHVLLPQGFPASSDPELAPISGLSTVAQALRYAKEHGDRVLLVAAHADPLADQVDDAANKAGALALSARRAANVHALVKGDRAAWAAACEGCDDTSLQVMLRWAAAAHDMGCDPGPIDGTNNAQTRAALLRFRAAYGAPAVDPPDPLVRPTTADFEAFFDRYEISLARLLGVEPDAIAQEHAGVKFHAPEQLACGSRWPAPRGPDAEQLRSQSKRRVDLVFFESGKPFPTLDGIEPPGAQLYADDRRARKRYLAPEVPPLVTCIRMTGMFFDTNKCFLLPSAMNGIRKLVQVYQAQPEGEILVVGHTDTTGDPSYNDPLSLERAEAVVAYLTDDADAWLKHYKSSVPEKKRWGAIEDRAMIGALPDAATHQQAEDPVKSFQQTRGVGPDMGSTRKQLITEYMALDRTTLPAGLKPTAHGCGENFPRVKTGNDVAEAQNRRVELFVFKEGIDPPPPGGNSKAGSSEYPHWLQAVVNRVELDAAMATLALKVTSPEGAAMGKTTVEISQFGQVLGTTATDARGLARFTGHDPNASCDVRVPGFACLAVKGVPEPGSEPVPAGEDLPPDHSSSGCDVDAGFVEPQPPQL